MEAAEVIGAAAVLQELGAGCIIPCAKLALAHWPAGGISHVLREEANGAGLGLGQEVVLESLPKSLSPFLPKVWLLALVVVVIPGACNGIQIPSGHSTNTDSSCYALSADDRAVCGSQYVCIIISIFLP